MWQIRAYETSKSHGFSTHNSKKYSIFIWDKTFLNQLLHSQSDTNTSRTYQKTLGWPHVPVCRNVLKPCSVDGILSGFLEFRSKFSGFGNFQILFFLENDPGGIKNSKVSKKTSEIKYLELDLIFTKNCNKKYPTIKKLQIFYTQGWIFSENFYL